MARPLMRRRCENEARGFFWGSGSRSTGSHPSLAAKTLYIKAKDIFALRQKGPFALQMKQKEKRRDGKVVLSRNIQLGSQERRKIHLTMYIYSHKMFLNFLALHIFKSFQGKPNQSTCSYSLQARPCISKKVGKEVALSPFVTLFLIVIPFWSQKGNAGPGADYIDFRLGSRYSQDIIRVSMCKLNHNFSSTFELESGLVT